MNVYLSENYNEDFDLKESNHEILLQSKSKRIVRNNVKSQSYDRHQNDRADISNSMQVLKKKFKDNETQQTQNVFNLERYSYQKHLIKCNENKDKVKLIFDNHSSWLKNMRNEVKYS